MHRHAGRDSEGSNYPEIARTNPIFIFPSYAFDGFRRRNGVPGVDFSKTNPILPGTGRRVGVRSFIKRFASVLRAEGGQAGRARSARGAVGGFRSIRAACGASRSRHPSPSGGPLSRTRRRSLAESVRMRTPHARRLFATGIRSRDETRRRVQVFRVPGPRPLVLLATFVTRALPVP